VFDFKQRGGRLAVAAVAVGALSLADAGVGAADAAARPTTTTFGALTSQDWPLVAQLTLDRRLVARIEVGLEEKCTSGVTIFLPPSDKAIPINRGGAFSDSFEGGPTVLGEGDTVSYSDQLRGKLNRTRTRITGTWHERTVFTHAGQSDTCDSGTVSFTATD